jgi:SAM-dependent methyltransferase
MWLARQGFVDAFVVYGSYNARAERWANDVRLLPPHLQLLFRLFLLGESVPRRELLQMLPEDDLLSLERLAIFLSDGDVVHTGHMVAIPIAGYLVFTERPRVNPISYFGQDSAALAAHLFPPAGAECLDLCSGPGVQAFLCAARARSVLAVELNPAAAAYGQLNVVMNELEDKVEVRVGDLYAAAGDDSFDFISANPPLLPFPQDLPYPFVGHGGDDGLSLTRRIIAGLPRALRLSGLCQIVGTCLGDRNGPAIEGELARTSRALELDIRLTVPAAVHLDRGSTMFNGLVWSCAAAAAIDIDIVQARYEAHLKALSADHLYPFFLSISRAATSPKFTLTRQYRQGSGFWFA